MMPRPKKQKFVLLTRNLKGKGSKGFTISDIEAENECAAWDQIADSPVQSAFTEEWMLTENQVDALFKLLQVWTR
jgi:hypothetical protein